MARSSRRRWPRRLLVTVVVAAATAALREWRLNENAKRYGH